MEEIDSWEVDGPVPGLKFRVRIVYDEDAKPYDRVPLSHVNPSDRREVTRYKRVYHEVYSKKDLAAWRADKWVFVGTIVTPVYRGIAIPDAEASLWGTQWGDYYEIDNRRCVAHVLAADFYDLPGEALSNLTDTLLGSAIAGHDMDRIHAADRADALRELQRLLKEGENDG